MYLKKIFIIILFIFSISIVTANNKYAVIVGINDYQSLTDLAAGVNDSEKIAAYYSEMGFKVWLINDRQINRLFLPSMQNLQRVMTNIDELSDDQRIDELVIFFAGHGVQIQGQNYLCFSETELTGRTGMLSVDQVLVPWIKGLNASLSLIYLDACRNDLGPMRAAGVQRGLEVKGIDKKDIGVNIAIFYAAKPGSFSFEKPDGSNGFFTDTLIEGLQSSQTTNIGSLYSYIRTALPERTEEVYGRPQIPHLGGDFDLTVSFSKGYVNLEKYDTSSKIFVESSEIGAIVKINGIIRGKTPLIIEGLNSGIIKVEVEKDGYYATEDVELLPKSFRKLKLDLKLITGDLLIKSISSSSGKLLSNLKLDLYVDGQYKGKHSAGLINELSPGGHDLVLSSDGWYWEDRITIIANDAKQIDVELAPVGELSVYASKGCFIKLKNLDEGYEIISDELDTNQENFKYLPSGAWNVSVFMNDYAISSGIVVLKQNDIRKFESDKNRTEYGQIVYELSELKQERILLEQDFEQSRKARSRNNLGKGIGTTLIGLASFLFYFSYEKYLDYMTATSESNAISLRDETTLFFNLGVASASAGSLGFVIPLFTDSPKYSTTKENLSITRDKISELEITIRDYHKE